MTSSQILALRDAATPAPWFNHGSAVSRLADNACVTYPPNPNAICSLNDGEYIENTNKNDAAFIAALPEIAQTALEALARVEELEKEAAYWRDRCHVIDPDLKTGDWNLSLTPSSCPTDGSCEATSQRLGG